MRWENSCCYCGKTITVVSSDFTKEHLLPKSKGGNNLLINKKSCCKNCNSWRNNQTLQQFKNNVIYHLNNSILIESYTKYDYFIMIENIEYWNEYLILNLNKLRR